MIHLSNKEKTELWTQLTDLCRCKGWSYNYLKRQKFPFRYKGWNFEKITPNECGGKEN